MFCVGVQRCEAAEEEVRTLHMDLEEASKATAAAQEEAQVRFYPTCLLKGHCGSIWLLDPWAVNHFILSAVALCIVIPCVYCGTVCVLRSAYSGSAAERYSDV